MKEHNPVKAKIIRELKKKKDKQEDERWHTCHTCGRDISPEEYTGSVDCEWCWMERGGYSHGY